MLIRGILLLLLFTLLSFSNSGGVHRPCNTRTTAADGTFDEIARGLVHDMAQAWESGDVDLLLCIVHDDIVFAYPGQRLDMNALVLNFNEFAKDFADVKIYINHIIITDPMVAVEWQFAQTRKETGDRTCVSDAIIGKVQDGKLVSWKEYLDGRVSRMQQDGELELEEGEEPYPWPLRTNITAV